MFHTIGYYAGAQTGTALTLIAALADQSTYVSGNDILVPQGYNYLAGAWAFGTQMTRAQLQSPSLRRVLQYEVNPQQQALTNVAPLNYVQQINSPIPLDPGEKLNAAVVVSATTDCYVVVHISDGPIVPVTGDIRSVRVTGSTTLVANTWSNVALTFDQVLPTGNYQIVGARFRSTGGLAFRFVYVGIAGRPGGLMRQQDYYDDHRLFRRGAMGNWGMFNYLTPPTIDVLSVSADTSQVGVLDLIKVS